MLKPRIETHVEICLLIAQTAIRSKILANIEPIHWEEVLKIIIKNLGSVHIPQDKVCLHTIQMVKI